MGKCRGVQGAFRSGVYLFSVGLSRHYTAQGRHMECRSVVGLGVEGME